MTKKMKGAAGVCLALVVSGCSVSDYYSSPIIDDLPEASPRYYQDLSECQHLADQKEIGGEMTLDAFVGAIGGAITGFLTGSLANAGDVGFVIGGSTGGASGFIAGFQEGMKTKKDVLRNCLLWRGHRMLD